MAVWEFGGYEIEFESEGMMQQARRVDAENHGMIDQMAADLAASIIQGEPSPSAFFGGGEMALVWGQVEAQIREQAEEEVEDNISDTIFGFAQDGLIGGIMGALSGGNGGLFDW